MTHRVYIDSILELVVKPWLEAWHGTSQANPVRTWKQQNGLKSCSNCAISPNLTPIENSWAIPKAYVGKYPHWDDAMLEELI